MSKYNIDTIAILEMPGPRPGQISYYPFSLHSKRASIFTITGQWTQAEETNYSNLSAARQAQSPKEIVAGANQLGFILLQRGKYQEALPLFLEAIAISEKSGLKHVNHDAMGNLGTLYRNQGDYAEAQKYFDLTKQQARAQGNDHSLSIVLGNQGLMYWYQGLHEKAMDCYNQKLSIDEKIGNLYLLGTDYGNIGGVHFSRGDFVQAENCYQKQISLARQIGDKYSLRVALNNLAGIYDNQENYQKALDCYQTSLKIARELGNLAGERVVLNNLGILLSYQGEYAQALKYATQSLGLARGLGDRRGEAIVMMTLGIIYKTKGGNAEALDQYKRAESIFVELSLKEYLCECQALIATALLDAERADLSLDYSRTASAAAVQSGNSEIIVRCKIIETRAGFLKGGQMTPEKATIGLLEMLPSCPKKMEVELNILLFEITHEPKYRQAALDAIHSRPNWQFRKDYREWVKELENISLK
ncbi:MAG: tetratricopeptide repeat protein [Candidatus Edwardsbacteria bacterium]|nr:tetratricopeptide repeat protein [Candidatus Edwardsbacteria bacterium]MBU2593604.1 tetratricopeptide repeat protein [Candidatus Edwardsbacteria bacterium]